MTTAVDSRPRRIASYMPLTVTTRDKSLILGGPTDTPELYDLKTDPHEQANLWEQQVDEGSSLMRRAISFLEHQGTPEEYLTPRRMALQRFASDSVRDEFPRADLTEIEERWTSKEAG
jgi:hypothetical protein